MRFAGSPSCALGSRMPLSAPGRYAAATGHVHLTAEPLTAAFREEPFTAQTLVSPPRAIRLRPSVGRGS